MLYYNFYGYEEFKARFGLEKRDNGVAVRKNKILLSHLQNPALLRYCREHNDYALLLSLIHIFPSISIRRAVRYMPVWVFMIPCSSSVVMWLPSVLEWRQAGQPYCWRCV